MDTDLADDVTNTVDERFTEEDFDEELGAPTEVLHTRIRYDTVALHVLKS